MNLCWKAFLTTLLASQASARLGDNPRELQQFSKEVLDAVDLVLNPPPLRLFDEVEDDQLLGLCEGDCDTDDGELIS